MLITKYTSRGNHRPPKVESACEVNFLNWLPHLIHTLFFASEKVQPTEILL